VHVGSRQGQHEARQTRAAADIPYSTRTQQWGDEGAVDDVTRPESFGFKRPDQSELFNLPREVGGVPARQLDTVSEEVGRVPRLRFDDQCFT
jgi:hypothetical protein